MKNDIPTSFPGILTSICPSNKWILPSDTLLRDKMAMQRLVLPQP